MNKLLPFIFVIALASCQGNQQQQSAKEESEKAEENETLKTQSE